MGGRWHDVASAVFERAASSTSSVTTAGSAANASADGTTAGNGTHAPAGGTTAGGAANTPANGTTASGDPVMAALQAADAPKWVEHLYNVVVALANTAAGQLVTILAFALIGAYVSRFVVRLLGRPIARRFHRQSIAQTILGAAHAGTVVLFALFGASLVGLKLGNIVLSVTVFSAVLGVVLAPIVGSIINGVFVLADQPYEIGDMIELDDDRRGFVDDINLRYTKLFTLDNTFIVIPNATIRERDVTNYSAEDERTRLSLDILVTYESDLPLARDLLERAARNCEDVIEGGPDIRIGSARYPATPRAYIESYADDGVLLRLRYWAKKPYKIGTVQSKVQERVWDLYADVDVSFAYPHQHLVFDETSGRARVSLGSEPEVQAGDRPDDDPGDDATPDGDGTVGGGVDDVDADTVDPVDSAEVAASDGSEESETDESTVADAGDADDPVPSEDSE